MIHHAQVIHHIPGRMRVKLPQAKGNHQLLLQIQQSISPLSGVKQVEINPATGSVLVHYDADQHEDFHTHLAEHAESEGLFALKPPELFEADEIAEKIEAEAEFLAAHSETARTVVNFVKQIDEGIKRATDNNLDLKVLLPLGLAVYAFLEAGTETVTPLWVTLGIFSFNSFVALHHPHPGVQVEEHQVIHDESPQPAPAARPKVVNLRSKQARKRG